MQNYAADVCIIFQTRRTVYYTRDIIIIVLI